LCKEGRQKSVQYSRSSSFLVTLLAFVFVIALLGACTTKKIIQNTSSSSGDTGEPEGSGQRRDSVACSQGKKTLPIDAFDINSDETKGTTCDIANVLDADDSFAAIDAPVDGTKTIDGHAVSGCLAAEFSDGVILGSLSMKMRPIGQGCGHQCTREGENGCGTGWKVAVFAGPQLKKLTWVQDVDLTTKDFFEYRIAVYEKFQAKFIAVCRMGSIATDDIAIESVYGFCN
jgi:hypothetical protein